MNAWIVQLLASVHGTPEHKGKTIQRTVQVHRGRVHFHRA